MYDEILIKIKKVEKTFKDEIVIQKWLCNFQKKL